MNYIKEKSQWSFISTYVSCKARAVFTILKLLHLHNLILLQICCNCIKCKIYNHISKVSHIN